MLLCWSFLSPCTSSYPFSLPWKSETWRLIFDIGFCYSLNSLLTNLDRVLKTRDIILLTKLCIVKVMVFPVVTHSCESWTTKKAEHQRIDAFRSCCWSRPLRVPWTARGSNQSILREINPEYSLEGLMLRLKLQYFGHLIQTADSLEKYPMLGKIKGRKRRAVRK